MMSVSESSTALIVPYGHDEAPRLDPFRAQHRLGLRKPRRLDHDVRAAHARLPVVGGDHGLAEVLRQASRTSRGSPAARMHADLVEVKQAVEQPHVPVRVPARADVAEHARRFAREVLAPERGDRARAHVGQPAASMIATGLPVADRTG
jgi:hypothetical protein